MPSNGQILSALDDTFAPRVLDGISRAYLDGVVVVLDSGRRDRAEQARLYELFRKGGPRAAPPGESAHEWGLAVDIAAEVSGVKRYSGREFQLAVQALSKAGCQFLSPLLDDPGHAQHPEWRQIAALRGGREAPQPAPVPLPARSSSPPPAAGTPSTCR